MMIRKTNLLKNDKFSAYSQNNVYMKTENLQTSGSFKIRAFHKKIEQYKKEGIKKIIAPSTGNQGKSISYLCQKLNLECEIVLPIATPYNILKEIQDYNATTTLQGKNFAEAQDYVDAYKIDSKTIKLDLAHDYEASLQYGKIVEEIIEDLPNTDIILVPVGSGSLINGVTNYISENNLNIKVYAVEPYNSAALALSIKNGKLSRLEDSYTIAKTIDTKEVSEIFFENIKNKIEDVIKVSDEELIDCFLDVIEENKMIVENAGLLSLAGTKYLQEKNKNVVCILSGGNVDITTVSTLLEYGLKNKGRIFTFRTMLQDKPGELIKISTIIAENNGNIIGVKHNQLAAISRQEKVEIIISVESLGLPHKFKINKALEDGGYEIEQLDEHLGSGYYE